ncbi:MAG: ABC transporter permease [Paludibacteraceae bacterium]|nr:ABC transporter permease [Paludibacteraceae bacterium]
MYRKELSYYFASPIAYLVIGLYLVGISLFLWVIPGEWNIIDSGYAQVDGLFMLSPWLLMFLCPALTMRLFAEERQSGTWNLLIAKKVPVWRIVLGKYMAAWTLTAIAILPCIIHYFVVAAIAEPAGNVDGGQFAGSLIGLIFLSGVFISLGLMAASTTKNQIVAYVFGTLVCFILYWVLIQAHYESISRGVIDLRDVIFFLSVIAISLIIAITISHYKK